MMTQLTTYAQLGAAKLTAANPAFGPGPGWEHGPGAGGPGAWIIVPILFWTLVLSLIGYVIYRRSPKQQARHAGERTLAERYARGEITEQELQQRRAVLRGKG
ncbi:MAG: SHOCT domain-containing protein [Micromonosporaceae bacterium]